MKLKILLAIPLIASACAVQPPERDSPQVPSSPTPVEVDRGVLVQETGDWAYDLWLSLLSIRVCEERLTREQVRLVSHLESVEPEDAARLHEMKSTLRLLRETARGIMRARGLRSEDEARYAIAFEFWRRGRRPDQDAPPSLVPVLAPELEDFRRRYEQIQRLQGADPATEVNEVRPLRRPLFARLETILKRIRRS